MLLDKELTQGMFKGFVSALVDKVLEVLRLKDLRDDLRMCKHMRCNYRIEWSFKCGVNCSAKFFAFLPTILFVPWVYRYPNARGIIEIWWLHYRISFGKWIPKEGKSND